MEPPTYDPLMHGVHLPLQAALFPFGFPLEIATNSPEVLRAAEECWSGFQQKFSEPPIRVRIAVSEDHEAELPATAVHRAQGYLAAIVSDRGNFAICDLARGFAFCWLAPAVAADRAWFRAYYLQTIVYLILWQLHLTPLHAACVALDGRGALLCGESGAGKSTLAFACARSGWTLLCDEPSLLLRRSKDRIVLGNPSQIRFREDAARLLPELQGRRATLRIGGKMTIELHTAGLGIATAFECRAERVIFLNRHSGGPARLVPVHQDEAFRRLLQAVALFEKEVHDEHRASLQNLLEAEAFELCYSDLDSAVGQLESLLRQGTLL